MISKIYTKKNQVQLVNVFVHDQMGENNSKGQHDLQLDGGQTLVCERKRLRYALFSS